MKTVNFNDGMQLQFFFNFFIFEQKYILETYLHYRQTSVKEKT